MNVLFAIKHYPFFIAVLNRVKAVMECRLLPAYPIKPFVKLNVFISPPICQLIIPTNREKVGPPNHAATRSPCPKIHVAISPSAKKIARIQHFAFMIVYEDIVGHNGIRIHEQNHLRFFRYSHSPYVPGFAQIKKRVIIVGLYRSNPWVAKGFNIGKAIVWVIIVNHYNLIIIAFLSHPSRQCLS